MEYLFPALYFQSVCVPCFEVGLLYAAYRGVLFLYPFGQSLPFGWGVQPIYAKVIIDNYDPVTIYFIVLGSGLCTLFVFPV